MPTSIARLLDEIVVCLKAINAHLVEQSAQTHFAHQNPLANIPQEISTDEAAQILGTSKDTVLKMRGEGLLKHRNAAPPSSSRPIYRFLLESVLELRTNYQVDEPTPRSPRAPGRRRMKGKKLYKYIDFD